MAETSLELSYPISFAEFIYTSSNTPTSDNLYCSTETESSDSAVISSVPVEIIYCTEYEDQKEAICTVGLFTFKDLPTYSSSLVTIPIDVLDSMQQNGRPSLKVENSDSNSLVNKIYELLNYVQNIGFEAPISSETLAITIGVSSIAMGIYLSKTSILYLASGTPIGALAFMASIYFDCPFINYVGVGIIHQASMKFFASSIEDTLITQGSRLVAPIAAIAASGITTTWILLSNEILSYTNSNMIIDIIPYHEQLPANILKRITQGEISMLVPLICESIPAVSPYKKTIKATSDILSLHIAGMVKEFYYVYRGIKDDTITEITGRQLVSATSKKLPGILFFDKYSEELFNEDKAYIQYSLEWSAASISRNIGKISFESIWAYFNPKQLNTTTPILSTKNPQSPQPTKSPVCSTYQLTKPDDDNDSYSNKI